MLCLSIYPMVKVHGTVLKMYVNTGLKKETIHGNCGIYFYPGDVIQFFHLPLEPNVIHQPFFPKCASCDAQINQVKLVKL